MIYHIILCIKYYGIQKMFNFSCETTQIENNDELLNATVTELQSSNGIRYCGSAMAAYTV